MTWHEDREISPGVPDVSFVMNGGECETGWLELKAEDYPQSSTGVAFKFRPQQHTWIEEHYPICPVLILAAAGDLVFLIPGKEHRVLDGQRLTVIELERLSILKVSMKDDNAKFALRRALISVTRRSNG